MDTRELRRRRLLDLVAAQSGAGKQRQLAKAIGKAPAQVSQWVNRTRTITEDSARQIERALKLPDGWMEHDPATVLSTAHAPNSPPTAASPPAAPAPDFRETRSPSASEWQVLRDLEVFPEEARRKRLDELHAEAEHWREIEREITARIKARAQE